MKLKKEIMDKLTVNYKKQYNYRVIFSEEDNEFVGMCKQFPSLSWLDKTQEGAFNGIRKLVGSVTKDMRKNDEL